MGLADDPADSYLKTLGLADGNLKNIVTRKTTGTVCLADSIFPAVRYHWR